MRAKKIIERADGTTEVIGNKVDNLQVQNGDLLHYITWGGGGWGDPLTRDAALVALEVKRGLVTSGAAETSYGVILADDGSADEAATEKLRKEMADARGDVDVFDFGPSIDELRANCEAETGLPAPIQPVWGEEVDAPAKAAE